MNQSESIGELAKALVGFQADLPPISKNSTVQVRMKSGGTYTFAYATLENIVETARPVMKEHGLAVSQPVSEGGLTTILMHESGEFISDFTSFAGISYGNAQELGSAISYLRRYALASILGIVSDEDDDGNVNAGNTYERQKNGRPPSNRSTGSSSVVPKILEAAEKLWGDPAHWDELDKLTNGKNVKDLNPVDQKRLLAHIKKLMGEVVE